MTWVSHQVVTFSTVFALTNNVLAAGCAAVGSTFPDWLEGPLWRLWHRSFTHWFVLYVPLLLLLYVPDVSLFRFSSLAGFGVFALVRFFLFWFFVGALFHIPEDAVCGTVPLLNPAKKVTVFPRLFTVRSVWEYVFVGVWSGMMCVWAFCL